MNVFFSYGITLAATHKLGRSDIGIEKEPSTCTYILERMKQVIFDDMMEYLK